MQIDYLIVGQGLAGSLLAWELIQRDLKVVVVDNGTENASQVAAGLINPVTGIRLVKSAEVDFLLPAAKQYYSALERFFKQTFFTELSMLRMFTSKQEAVYAEKRRTDPTYQAYLEFPPADHQLTLSILPNFGYLHQKQSGYLRTQALLQTLRDFFIERRCYRQMDFNHLEMDLEPELQWRELSPAAVVFCEGYQAKNNPWFAWLPFQPAKGEILTYQVENNFKKIIHFGNWLLPLSSHTIKLGATFERTQLNTEPTPLGKEQLLSSFKSMPLDLSAANLANHQAGIRPCTLDKQPFIGRHPTLTKCYIFNGFGSKGSLMLPWYSRHFADFLQHQKPLDSLCNVQRYYAMHCTSKT